MKMQISRKFTFDAAHHLTKYYGKCERPHGHTYALKITLEGPVQKNGMVVDFALVKKIVEKEVLSKLDHHDLNSIFDNPSAENVAVWVWKKLEKFSALAKKKIQSREYLEDIKKYWESKTTSKKPELPNVAHLRLMQVKLCETANCCVVIRV